jgi:hypothetical protein
MFASLEGSLKSLQEFYPHTEIEIHIEPECRMTPFGYGIGMLLLDGSIRNHLRMANM